MSTSNSVDTTSEAVDSEPIGFLGLTTSHARELGLTQSGIRWGASRPVSTSDKLVKKANYFIVPFEGAFYYIKIDGPIQLRPNLYSWSPPTTVVHEGFVIIDKKVIYVTLDDINRKVIRTSREINVKKGTIYYEDFVNGTFSPAPTPAPTINVNESGAAGTSRKTGGGTETLPADGSSKTSKAPTASNNSSVEFTVSVEELEAINLAMQMQERALLDFEFEEA